MDVWLVILPILSFSPSGQTGEADACHYNFFSTKFGRKRARRSHVTLLWCTWNSVEGEPAKASVRICGRRGRKGEVRVIYVLVEVLRGVEY